jgi:phosphatidylinositol-bisphosphatase
LLYLILVNGKAKIDEEGLGSWLCPENEEMADIYAIGFQEMVELTPVNVAVDPNGPNRTRFWEEHLSECLNKHGNKYSHVGSKSLVGILLVLFVRVPLVPDIKDIRWASSGVGVMGVMGNKGAVIARFVLEETSICFVCAHLAASRENITARNSDYRSINDRTILSPERFAYDILESYNATRPTLLQETLAPIITISEHDMIFWIGDFNYRIDVQLSREDIMELIEKNDIHTLRSYDQLTIERNNNRVFQGFLEGELNFLPTYKYQAGTDIYDVRPEKKLRPPAWCDRILWRSNDVTEDSNDPYKIEQLHYRRAELRPSDHKPISALFQCKVRKIIPQKEQEMYAKFIRELDKMENAEVPKVEIGPSMELILDHVTFEVRCTKT